MMGTDTSSLGENAVRNSFIKKYCSILGIKFRHLILFTKPDPTSPNLTQPHPTSPNPPILTPDEKERDLISIFIIENVTTQNITLLQNILFYNT
jgi:hypothetical protein